MCGQQVAHPMTHQAAVGSVRPSQGWEKQGAEAGAAISDMVPAGADWGAAPDKTIQAVCCQCVRGFEGEWQT